MSTNQYPTLDNEVLFEIIEEGGHLDTTAKCLESLGFFQEADAVLKLQQDAGLELDPTFNPDDLSNPPGAQTAALWAQYEPVTRARYHALIAHIDTALKSSQHPQAEL